jgi:PIN domain nuclease of toxin-antitoxin system
LPQRARELLRAGRPQLPAIAVLELTYLHEVGRARDSAATMVEALRRSIGLSVADLSMAALVEAAAGLSWTRDPFDRLISAHAAVAGVPLITADRTILEHLPQAAWD